MAELDAAQLVAAVGVICQLMIDSLLLGLFILLRRHAAGRTWFRAWTWAWSFLALALACITWSYFGPLPASLQPAGIHVLQFTYLAGKLAFALYLVAGYLVYAHAPRRLVRFRYLLPAGIGWAAVAYAFSPGIMPTIIWQGLPNVALFLVTAIVIAHIPVRRRTLGLKVSGTTFGVMAALWLIYVISFSPQLRPAMPQVSELFVLIARNNAFFDLATHIMLAFGMVLILLEDAKREVDAAHIKLDRAHQRLRDQSLRDPLTGCLNRRAFTERVGLELVEIGGCVVVADLDNLKRVNDRYGHSAGDALLQYFAANLRTALRASDSLYRWGGDEFLLLLPEGESESVLPRLAAHLKAVPPCELSRDVHVTVEASIGAADFRNGGDFREAIHAADREMYRQKRVRKNRSNIRPV